MTREVLVQFTFDEGFEVTFNNKKDCEKIFVSCEFYDSVGEMGRAVGEWLMHGTIISGID